MSEFKTLEEFTAHILNMPLVTIPVPIKTTIKVSKNVKPEVSPIATFKVVNKSPDTTRVLAERNTNKQAHVMINGEVIIGTDLPGIKIPNPFPDTVPTQGKVLHADVFVPKLTPQINNLHLSKDE